MMHTPQQDRTAPSDASRFDFGLIAESYDRWYETPRGRAYDLVEKRAVARLLPHAEPAARLLEVGCGTAHWSAFFSARGFTVTGVDSAPEMIAVARGKGVADASFEVGDAHALPFENGEFDVTAAITTLEFVRDAEAVVQEMARCTRGTGGCILIGVLNTLAAVNARRKAAGDAPYSAAHYFSPRQVKAILEPYGKPHVAVAAFVPQTASAPRLWPLCDFIGRVFHRTSGAFIVGRVML